MTLRVGVDAGALLRPHTGVGRYTEELVRGLGRLDDGPGLTLLVNAFRASALDALPADLPGRAVNPRIPYRVLDLLWRRVRWPSFERLAGPVDVVHASDWVMPPTRGAPVVTTVHDVGALVHPEWYTPDVVSRHREKNRETARRADAIVTVSEYTRGAFLDLFDVDPRRVYAVPNGVRSDFRAPSEAEGRRLREAAGIRAPYLLFVGTREPRKNLPGLVEIFARVAERLPGITLVLAGMRPWAEAQDVQGVRAWTGPELEARIAGLGLESRVRVTGRVPLDLLRALYAGAEAFVYPTLYEGFGLPALEAMACGAPVVASEVTAVPEVVGEAGVLADPTDPDAFAERVVEVVESDAVRERLRSRGLARAAELSWDRTAALTLDVYREVLACRS